MDLRLLEASSAACRMQVARVSLLGWHRHILQRMTSSDLELSYLFGGILYPVQPIWSTRLEHYRQQILRHLRIVWPTRTLFGIIADPGCNVRNIPWQDLTAA